MCEEREEDQRHAAELEASAQEQSEEEQCFSLLRALIEDDALLDVIRLMPAASAARLARISKAAHERLTCPDVALWCAESRKLRS